MPPLTRASHRRSGAVAGRSHRKPRSRSSPVRAGTASPDGRARSPSVSPPRLSLARVLTRASALPPHSHTPLISVEHHRHLVTQRAGLSYTSAYFSLRPPATPVRLVPGASAPATTPVGPSVHCIPPPPPLRSAKKFSSAIPVHEPKQEAKVMRESSCKCRRLVRRLLADMVAALPLVTPPAAGARPGCAAGDIGNSQLVTDKAGGGGARSPGARRSHSRAEEMCLIPVSSCSRTGEPAAPRTDSRSVAVQALTTKRDTEGEDVFYSYDETQKDGWVGGVRALRDSHVRLVLRQLRHIERLNRALDRAARPPPSAHPHRTSQPL